jgi:hypothetical protein
VWPGEALSGIDQDTSPSSGKEACGRRLFSQVGERNLTIEGSSPCRGGRSWARRLVSQRGLARGMHILWKDHVSPTGNAHGGRAAETRCGGQAEGIITRHRCGNCGQDWPVLSHQHGVLDGMADNAAHSPAGLCHHPKLCDIFLACKLATVVSP